MSLPGSFSSWKAWLRLHAMGWRITVFPHSNGVAQGSPMASGLVEGRDLPITQQISTTTGDGGSCQHCCACDSPRQTHCGYPYLFSTVIDAGPFVAQYGHAIFPGLDASRISPFLFFSEAPSLSRLVVRMLECCWYRSCKHANFHASKGV